MAALQIPTHARATPPFEHGSRIALASQPASVHAREGNVQILARQ
jgi:hypothetical protein